MKETGNPKQKEEKRPIMDDYYVECEDGSYSLPYFEQSIMVNPKTKNPLEEL